MKTYLSMLVILMAGLSGAVASADAIPLSPWGAGTMSNNTWSFGVNAESGTAWVNFRVNTAHGGRGENALGLYYKHKDYTFVSIKGLSYDAAQAKIIYVNQAGKKVICATTEADTNFWGNPVLNINTTGACDLRNEKTVVKTGPLSSHEEYRVRFLSK